MQGIVEGKGTANVQVIMQVRWCHSRMFAPNSLSAQPGNAQPGTDGSMRYGTS